MKPLIDIPTQIGVIIWLSGTIIGFFAVNGITNQMNKIIGRKIDQNKDPLGIFLLGVVLFLLVGTSVAFMCITRRGYKTLANIMLDGYIHDSKGLTIHEISELKTWVSKL